MSLIVAYIGILSVLIIALNANFLGRWLGLMDDPKKEEHKQHALATPLVGALMVVTLAVFILVNHFILETSSRLVGVSVCTILMGFLGLLDDKLQLGWGIRLMVMASISGLLIFWVPELQLQSLNWSFGYNTHLGAVGGSLFTIICLMTVVVSFNMMDGFNGGVIGMCLILFIVMAIVATNPHRQAICLFIASALGIMFVYNLKGEFFLGDGGAYALALLAGSVALLTYNEPAKINIYADTIFVWLAVPTLDCLRVIVLRKLKKNSPFYASRDHLHHLLMAISGPKRTLVFFLCLIGAATILSLFAGQYTYLLLIAEAILIGAAAFYSVKYKPVHPKATSENR